MRTCARLLVSRLLDIGEATSASGRALLQERYRALQRQVPLLYTIAIVNFAGLVFASGAQAFTLFHPANLLLVLVAVRLGHWIRTRNLAPTPERIIRELRRTLVLAALLSIGFCYSAIELFAQSEGYGQDLVILFASLAA